VMIHAELYQEGALARERLPVMINATVVDNSGRAR